MQTFGNIYYVKNEKCMIDLIDESDIVECRRRKEKYNETNTCPRIKEDGNVCEEQLIKTSKGHPYRELDKNGNLTGRWICHKCYQKDYQKNDPNSKHNIRKALSDNRSGNLCPKTTTSKGNKFQKLACEWKRLIDLNKEDDNYNSPIDCIDEMTGVKYQIKGKLYDPINRYWQITVRNDHNKQFSSTIIFCADQNGKIIERIYDIPKEEVVKRSGITIVKNPSNRNGRCPGGGWYEHYRIKDKEELKKVNDIWKEII